MVWQLPGRYVTLSASDLVCIRTVEFLFTIQSRACDPDRKKICRWIHTWRLQGHLQKETNHAWGVRMRAHTRACANANIKINVPNIQMLTWITQTNSGSILATGHWTNVVVWQDIRTWHGLPWHMHLLQRWQHESFWRPKAMLRVSSRHGGADPPGLQTNDRQRYQNRLIEWFAIMVWENQLYQESKACMQCPPAQKWFWLIDNRHLCK